MSGQREIGEGLVEVLQVSQIQTRAAGGTVSTNSWERCVCTNGYWCWKISGKSLCMFLAPLAIGESTVGVIISALKALMDQQVNAYHIGHYITSFVCNFIAVLISENAD